MLSTLDLTMVDNGMDKVFGLDIIEMLVVVGYLYYERGDEVN